MRPSLSAVFLALVALVANFGFATAGALPAELETLPECAVSTWLPAPNDYPEILGCGGSPNITDCTWL